MASDPTQADVVALPDKQVLIDHIKELFRRARKISAQSIQCATPTPSDSDTATHSFCVKQLLQKDSEGSAREAYFFMPSNHNVSDVDRISFRELQQQWESGHGKIGKGDGSYPEVRRKSAIEPFSRRILRCMCSLCRRGKAAELECDTCDFGNGQTILTYQFHWEGQIWALILGTRDDPAESSVWGKIDDTSEQMSYNDRILLKEVSSAKPPARSSRRAADGGEDGDFLPDTELHKKRKNASTAVNSSKRRQTLNSTPGKRSSAWVGIEENAKCRTDTIVSDDEDLMLSQLSASRRKAVASPIGDDRSATTAIPARVSPSPHASSYFQQPQPHDLQKLLRKTKAHVYSQADSNGKPVNVLIVGLAGYIRSLTAAADANDATSFKMIRDIINEELAEIGVPALPGV